MGKIDIGAKILQYRRQKGFTIKELAKKTKLTSSMLSQIERGNANPSINSLRIIAKALDIPLVNFFEDEDNVDNLVVKANQRKKLMMPCNRGFVYESLSPNLSGKIQMVLLKLNPGEETTETMMSHDGEEAALVLDGKIKIYLEDGVFELDSGDSIRIPPGKPHKWENIDSSTVTVIFAISPPSF